MGRRGIQWLLIAGTGCTIAFHLIRFATTDSPLVKFVVHDSSLSQKETVNTTALPVSVGKDFSLYETSSPNSSERVVTFMHIGKAGGTTIRTILRAGCVARIPRQRQPCLDSLPPSNLSDAVKGSSHCLQHHPHRNIVHESNSYLYNLRHPLDRAVSWYNAEIYKVDSCTRTGQLRSPNCGLVRAMNEDPNGFSAQFFRHCFPTLEDWANTTSATTTTPIKTTINCTQLASDTFQGNFDLNSSTASAAHMIANIRRNSDISIGQNPGKEVLVVRTIHMWEDLIDLEKWLGGHGNFGSMGGQAANTKRVDKKHRSDVFSESVTRKLCCILADEVLAYSDLIHAAANLNDTVKREELSYLANHCGASSWSEWMLSCGVSARNSRHSISSSSPVMMRS